MSTIKEYTKQLEFEEDFQVKLKQLKAKRHASVLQSSSTRLKQYIRHYQDLRIFFPFFTVFSYASKQVVRIFWRMLIAQVWNPMMIALRKQLLHNPQQIKTSEIRYAILITGGLGDAIVIARFVRDFQAHLNHACVFDLYFHSPESVASFFRNIKGFGKSLVDNLFPAYAPQYDFALTANVFITFSEDHINRRVLSIACPQVLKNLDHIKKTHQDIHPFITHHPSLDGLFSDWAAERQFKRHSYLHAMAGISYGGHALDINVDDAVIERFGLTSKRFITIHDGWDNHIKTLNSRPTKALPFDTWVKLVQRLKAERPDLTIVQLGGGIGADIPGVDVNLKNQLTFSESTSVLAHSAIHVDAESGLVHLGAALGIQCVVIFGPTNLEWFSYPENINIPPKQCGNCWRTLDAWMDYCVLGQEKPVCMNNVDVEEVVSCIQQAIFYDERKE